MSQYQNPMTHKDIDEAFDRAIDQVAHLIHHTHGELNFHMINQLREIQNRLFTLYNLFREEAGLE